MIKTEFEEIDNGSWKDFRASAWLETGGISFEKERTLVEVRISKSSTGEVMCSSIQMPGSTTSSTGEGLVPQLSLMHAVLNMISDQLYGKHHEN